jgi:hypothetical protein
MQFSNYLNKEIGSIIGLRLLCYVFLYLLHKMLLIIEGMTPKLKKRIVSITK